jgi:hypothetical protein
MLEGGQTPLLPPAELGRLGFSMAIYGISLLMHAARAMQGVLAELARGGIGFAGGGVGFEEYKDIVSVDRWSRIPDLLCRSDEHIQPSLIPSFSNDREQAAERPALRYGFGEAGHER